MVVTRFDRGYSKNMQKFVIAIFLFHYIIVTLKDYNVVKYNRNGGADLHVNEIYEINGAEKDFLSWCKQFNQKPETSRSRMSLGSSLDDALHTFSTNFT